MLRIATTDQVKAAAPLAPPCFPTRGIWIEYLTSAQRLQGRSFDPAPLPLRPWKGGWVWNEGFTPCHDCTASHERAMRKAGKCTKADAAQEAVPA